MKHDGTTSTLVSESVEGQLAMVTFTEAQHRYATARGYLQTVRTILLSPIYPGREITFVLSLHLLAGFATELYLKAWLLQAGIPSSDVKRSRHDIASLFQEVERHNFPNIARLDEIVSGFAAPHKELTYRYLDEGDSINPANWPIVLAVLSELDIAVDTFTGSSATQGRQPGH